ncbi:MAG: anaerobic ribonucleoside-triphosphate reductase activating protein [Clostridia bacterium]|nr:anaerobic ribonucleoside-triphosphate reductase activating protein [Clostridia bacterium]
MVIYGLQKMTLLDFPGRVACTVFLGGCDFRCPFCHNFDLASGKETSVSGEEEFFAFLRGRRGLLDGVAVTGGEPCLSPGLPAFLARVREEGFAAKLDTNGYHPEVLRSLISDGLVDYVAMDVKNSPAKYAGTCGVSSLDLSRITESIAILNGSSVDHEFRTTVVDGLHEVSDIEEIGKMIKGADRYFIQAFVDRDSVPFGGFRAPDRETMFGFLETARKYVPGAALRGID